MYRPTSAPYQFGWKAGGKILYPFSRSIGNRSGFNFEYSQEVFNCVCESGVGSFLPCLSQESDSGCQAWGLVSLPIEPLADSKKIYF